MSVRIITAALVAVILAGGAVSAQLFSAEVSPNPVVVGQPIQIKIECNTGGTGLLSGCAYTAFYKDKPGGTVVYSPFICPSIFITVGPGLPHTTKWNCVDSSNKPIQPGTYFVEIIWGANKSKHYAPFQVVASLPNTQPLLSTTTATTRGKPLGLTINSANQPNANYVIAASFTANTGFQLTPTARIDLDQDGLFWFSLALPTGPIFQNFQGVLDRTGIAKATMAVPAITALQGAQLALQGVTVQGTIIQTTNALTRVIL